jgi:hypothetical protein
MTTPSAPRPSRAALLAFAGVLWGLSCLACVGSLGRYSDDWAFGAIDPATGAFDASRSPFHQAYFWRPLLQLFLHYAISLLWNHLWVLHVLNAVTHAGTTLVVHRLLRGVGASPRAAAVAALLFMVWPNHHEVIFWPTAMTTGFATLLGALLGLVAVAWTRRGMPLDRSLLWFPALAFLIPCWYEQPSAIVPVLPLVCLAARTEGSARRCLAHSLVPTMLAGVVTIAYVLLLRGTAPSSARGAASSYIHLSDIPSRAAEFSSAAVWFHTAALSDAVIGGLSFSRSQMDGFPGLVAIGLVLIAAVAWVLLSWTRANETAEHGARRMGTRTLLAVSLLMTSMLPIFVIKGQIFEARHHYFMMLPGAMLAAIVLDALAWRAGRARLIAVGLGAAAGVTLLAGSLLGFQFLMRERTRADLAQMQSSAAGAPAAPPGVIFMALEDNYRPARTGRLFFDARLIGWITASWSANPGVQFAFRRDDVFATVRNFWVGMPISDIDGEGYRYNVGPNQSGPPDPIANARHRWDQTIPYIIGEDGTIRFVSSMVVKRSGAADLTLSFPSLTTAASGSDAARPPIAGYTLQLP